MKQNKVKMYIVLSFTGTILSRIIKFYMHDEYAHISISFDKELYKMYSFGRLNPYNAFVGGYVEEGKKVGTFKRFKNTKCLVYSLDISKSQYEKINSVMKKIKKSNPKYKFNRSGLFAMALHKKINHPKSFYCAEYIKYLFDVAEIENNLPLLVRPIHFLNIPNIKFVYEGLLKDY